MVKKVLDFNGKISLYQQLYDILHKDIISGKYKPGDMLPSETNLMEDYGVSRITVRKTMDMLSNENLIQKQRGIGSRVLPRYVEQTLNRVVHFSNDMKNHGYNYSSEMLENKMINPTPSMKKHLNLYEKHQTSPLIKVKRLRNINGIPACIEEAYLIYNMCPDVYNMDFSVKSLRLFLEDEYNIKWVKSRQRIFARKVGEENAKYLKLSLNDPVLYIERITYTSDNQPGEFLRGFYRSDIYCFYAELED